MQRTHFLILTHYPELLGVSLLGVSLGLRKAPPGPETVSLEKEERELLSFFPSGLLLINLRVSRPLPVEFLALASRWRTSFLQEREGDLGLLEYQ